MPILTSHVSPKLFRKTFYTYYNTRFSEIFFSPGGDISSIYLVLVAGSEGPEHGHATPLQLANHSHRATKGTETENLANHSHRATKGTETENLANHSHLPT